MHKQNVKGKTRSLLIFWMGYQYSMNTLSWKHNTVYCTIYRVFVFVPSWIQEESSVIYPRPYIRDCSPTVKQPTSDGPVFGMCFILEAGPKHIQSFAHCSSWLNMLHIYIWQKSKEAKSPVTIYIYIYIYIYINGAFGFLRFLPFG